jgi:hypothetical protein
MCRLGASGSSSDGLDYCDYTLLGSRGRSGCAGGAGPERRRCSRSGPAPPAQPDHLLCPRKHNSHTGSMGYPDACQVRRRVCRCSCRAASVLPPWTTSRRKKNRNLFEPQASYFGSRLGVGHGGNPARGSDAAARQEHRHTRPPHPKETKPLAAHNSSARKVPRLRLAVQYRRHFGPSKPMSQSTKKARQLERVLYSVSDNSR